MPLTVKELFGYSVDDLSPTAESQRSSKMCPFVLNQCSKILKSGLISGACTLKPTTSRPVICCPSRLYADNYKILNDVASDAFGPNMRLIRSTADAQCDGCDVVVFGKQWGKELRLPSRRQGGGFFVDWVLARLNSDRSLEEFVAVEVQTMDTTGSYEAHLHTLLHTGITLPKKQSNINWENVSKRILPQLIYKGHVLRQEALCRKGLYFICPTPVCERIISRLGGGLRTYHQQPGALTFRHYGRGVQPGPGYLCPLICNGQMTTTVDQVALAFTAPSNLPAPGAYERAIRASLH